jgi:hypothetical protein
MKKVIFMISVLAVCGCSKKETPKPTNTQNSTTKTQESAGNKDSTKTGIQIILDTTMQDTTIILK